MNACRGNVLELARLLGDASKNESQRVVNVRVYRIVGKSLLANVYTNEVTTDLPLEIQTARSKWLCLRSASQMPK